MKTRLIVSLILIAFSSKIYALDVVGVRAILESFGEERVIESIYENYTDSARRDLVKSLVKGIMLQQPQDIPMIRSDILSKYGERDFRSVFHSFYVLSNSVSEQDIQQALSHLYTINKYLLTTQQITTLFEYALKGEDKQLINNILTRSVLRERNAQRRKENSVDFISNFDSVYGLIEGDNITAYAEFLVRENRVDMARRLLEKGNIAMNRREFIFGKEHIVRGEHIAVVNYYSNFIKNHPNSPLAPDAYREIARAYNRAGKRDSALQWYRKIPQSFPNSQMGASSLWWLGWHFEMRDELEEAVQYYKKLAGLQGVELAVEGRFRAGLCYYKMGQYFEALGMFSGLPASAKRKYWTGKSHEKMGDSTTAKNFFRRAASYGILDFYGIRAIQKIYDSFEIPSQIDKSTIRNLPESLKNDLKFLESLSLDFFVRHTVEEAEHGLSNKDLAYRLKNLGLIEHSHRIARVFRANYAKNRVTPDVFYMKMIFPKGISPQIDTHPHFDIIYSVMKQESAFIERIKSPVGASGLMQIMPATGREVASQKSLTFTVDSLLKKDYNIRLGIFILEGHIEVYGGDLVYILSAYNAGPGRANRWRPLLDRYEDDLRAETIEFRETRDYFRKVYTNMFNYNLIYRGKLIRDFKVR